MTIIFVTFSIYELQTIAVLLYPIITVLILVWRSVREDYDIFILDKLVFDINNNLNEVQYAGKYLMKEFYFFKLKFYQYKTPIKTVFQVKIPPQTNAQPLQIHFDIANRGNSEVTLHDAKIQLLYPNKEIITSFPLFESFRAFDAAEGRFKEVYNMLLRKKLEKGGLHTRIFPLTKVHKFMLIQIDVNTYKLEASNKYLLVFDEDHFFYAKLNEGFFKRGVEHLIRNRAKIVKYLEKLKPKQVPKPKQV